jgi:hypothetical protein
MTCWTTTSPPRRPIVSGSPISRSGRALVRHRLRRVCHRRVRPADRGLARRHQQSHRLGDDAAADGVVATRPRGPSHRGGELIHHSDSGPATRITAAQNPGRFSLATRLPHLVRQRVRLKNQVQAILFRKMLDRPPVADLFGKRGRFWVRAQPLPADERQTVTAFMRQLDFRGEELALVDGELAAHVGPGPAGARPPSRSSNRDPPRGRGLAVPRGVVPGWGR